MNHLIKKIALILSLISILGCGGEQPKSSKPKVVRLDFATYNPVSLVLKSKGWLEQALAAEGIEVEWTQVISGPQAISFIQGDNLDFGSTAVTAAMVNFANGVPIKVVYVFSQPEWTALVTRIDTNIRTVADLRGKKVAAPHGTDPYLFLIRALEKFGLSEKDIEVVPLAHPDGAAALTSGSVDAWAGLDPMMAKLELSNQARLFYRDRSIPSYGVLVVSQKFAENYPDLVVKVLQVYEKARLWVKDNPDETAEILAQVAQLDKSVALFTLQTRTVFTSPIPKEEVSGTLVEALRIFKQSGNIKADVDTQTIVTNLIDPSFIEKALK